MSVSLSHFVIFANPGTIFMFFARKIKDDFILIQQSTFKNYRTGI
jgi:hypothetical protein